MKMRWISIAMILMAMIVVAAGGQSLQFLETEYYVIPLGESGIAADVLVEQVQTVGMSTIVYGVDGVTALRAGRRPTRRRRKSIRMLRFLWSMRIGIN